VPLQFKKQTEIMIATEALLTAYKNAEKELFSCF